MSPAKPPLRVSAVVATDDGLTKATFDAAPWFRLLLADSEGDDFIGDEDIRVLAGRGWGRCDVADSIALACEDQRGVARVFEYIETARPKRDDGGIVGFEVAVNPREAMLWLREHREALWWELYHLAQEWEAVTSRQPIRPELARALAMMAAAD